MWISLYAFERKLELDRQTDLFDILLYTQFYVNRQNCRIYQLIFSFGGNFQEERSKFQPEAFNLIIVSFWWF